MKNENKKVKAIWIVLTAIMLISVFVAIAPAVSATEAGDLEEIQKAIEESGAEWQADYTSVSGLSPKEKQQLCGLKIRESMKNRISSTSPVQQGQPPAAFDWRDNGGDWTTPIRNQGPCGSCWAFGSQAAMEAHIDLQKGDPTFNQDLAEQQLLSCSSGDCSGWFQDDVLDWLRDEGTVDESCFPYQADDTIPCSDQCPDWASMIWKITGWGWVSPTIPAIKGHLLDAPLVTGMAVYEDFSYYTGGVYEHVWGELKGHHLVSMVGYVDIPNSVGDATSYWICKNSWGPDWGEAGWFWIGYGQCEIENMNAYIVPPIIEPNGGEPDIWVDPTSFDVTLPPDTIQDYTMNIENDGDALLMYDIKDAETTPTPLMVAQSEVSGDTVVGASVKSHEHTIELKPPTSITYPISWIPQEISYDDGSAESVWAWTEPGSRWAVRFTPPSHPVDLDIARICIGENWPDGDHEEFEVEVWDDSGAGGSPGAILGSVTTTATAWGWHDVDISGLGITITNGDFYIAYKQLTYFDNCEGLCIDKTDPQGRSWEKYNGEDWEPLPIPFGTEGNWMIRCVVDLPDCPWLDENPKSGSVPPSEHDEITVTIDTTGLAAGEYSADIIIANNDPDENPTIVPVDLRVEKPDLVVEKSVTIEDCKFIVNYTVTNIGDGAAGASTTCKLVDGTIEESQPCPALNPGESYSDTFDPEPCTCGETLNVTVCADNDNVVKESNEANNCEVNEVECPPCLPDLVITNIWTVGNKIHYTIKNKGCIPAPISRTGLYIDDIYRAYEMDDPLAPGEESDEVFARYTYRGGEIKVCADYSDRIEEIDETNNCRGRTPAKKPDLVITDKEEIVDPDTGTFTVTYTVNNIGICDAGASVACVHIEGEHQEDEDVDVGALAAGECTDPIEVGPFDCPLCEDIEVEVCADYYDAVEECDEENNCVTDIVICPCGVPLPDLVIMDILVVDNRIHYTIENIGGEPAPTSYTGLYIDDRYRASEMDDPLAPGDESDEVFARYTYRGGDIRVCADYPDRIEEIDETNNCRGWTPAKKPDLVITDKEEIVDPDTDTFTVTYTVNNIGICDAGASVACVHIEGEHQEDEDVDVGALAAGECTDPIEVGPFDCPLCEDIEVEVCADYYDAVEECDEENNCVTDIVICPCGVPLPDLVITDILVVDNRIHYTIENIGGEPAPTSYTGLYIDGRYLARDRVDPLAPDGDLDEVFAGYNYRGGEIRVCADYQDRIEEIDEENNCLEEGNNG